MADIVLINPRFEASYWGLEHALHLAGKKANMPVAALPLLAALTPPGHTITVIDENVEPIDYERCARADIVGLTGMIVQRFRMSEILTELKKRGCFVVLGGPWVSVKEDYFGELADVVFVGEAETTWPQFLEEFAAGTHSRRYEQAERTDMSTVPVPRFDLLKMKNYVLGTIQFSRGCPFMCEFCDIIVTFGRKPRLKTAGQITAELDALLKTKMRAAFIVDDNLIGNKKALKKFLPQLTAWQAARGYPFMFSTEASLNLADDDELLAMLAAANFFIVFIGIESGDTDTLVSMQKKQNTRRSIAQSVNKIYGAGIHAIAGFIIGFDTERASVARDMIETIEATNIPIGIVGLLTSLPNTQLQRRLEREDRIIEGWAQSPDGSGDQCTAGLNFKTLRPRRDILVDYKTVLESVYSPEAFFGRLERMTAQLVRPRLKVKLERRHWARNLRIFGRLCAEITLRRREMAPLFWRYLVRTLWRNPRSIEFVVMNIIMYLHVGRFTRFVISDMERRIGEIDAGLDPTRPRLSDADLARTAEKQVAA